MKTELNYLIESQENHAELLNAPDDQLFDNWYAWRDVDLDTFKGRGPLFHDVAKFMDETTIITEYVDIVSNYSLTANQIRTIVREQKVVIDHCIQVHGDLYQKEPYYDEERDGDNLQKLRRIARLRGRLAVRIAARRIRLVAAWHKSGLLDLQAQVY